MPVISIVMEKGGSGKTTTAINLGAALQMQGKKVLLVDIDPQTNLTQSLGIIDEPEINLFTELKKEMDDEDGNLEEALKPLSGGLHLIPASAKLLGAEQELVSVYEGNKKLSWLLEPLENKYDFIFIDCPTSMGMLTQNALVACRFVLMPLQAEFLPFNGVTSFMNDHFTNIINIRKKLAKEIDVLGFVLTKYDEHKKMNREICLKLEEKYGKVFNSRIRSNMQLAKAQEAGMDIFNFDKYANGATDYMELSKEFLERIRVFKN